MNRRANGFTLLELLVALTVLGFLVAGLAQGVHFGQLAWANEGHLSSDNDGFDAVDTALRQVIENMDPGDDTDPAPFIGNGKSLSCITKLPAVQRVQATLLVDHDHRLVLRWQPYLHAMHLRPPPAPTDTELLHGVSRIELAFWRGGGWLQDWRSTDLPTLVRIRVIFPAGDPRHWPDIVAAPLLDRP